MQKAADQEGGQGSNDGSQRVEERGGRGEANVEGVGSKREQQGQAPQPCRLGYIVFHGHVTLIITITIS